MRRAWLGRNLHLARTARQPEGVVRAHLFGDGLRRGTMAQPSSESALECVGRWAQPGTVHCWPCRPYLPCCSFGTNYCFWDPELVETGSDLAPWWHLTNRTKVLLLFLLSGCSLCIHPYLFLLL